jgi:signal transduction histidine kinase
MSLPGMKAFTRASRMPTERIPRPWLVRARGAWIIFALVLLAIFVSNIPGFFAASSHSFCTLPDPGNCPTGQLTPGNAQALARLHLSIAGAAGFLDALVVAVSLMYWVVGLLIFWRKSQEWIGLFFSLMCVMLGAIGVYGFHDSAQTPWLVQSLTNSTSSVLNLLGPFFLFTFPTGRFTPRWIWAAFVFFLLGNLPFVPFVGSLLTYPLAVGVQVYRYVRVYDAVQRQQTKWFVFGVGIGFSFLALYYVFGTVVPGLSAPDSWYQLLNPPVWLLIWTIVLLSLSIAILRYRLWDIDVLINRTLVYGTLSAGIVGVYVLIVGGFGTLMQAQGNPVLSLVAAALVAVLFQPLRQRLQQAVNRLMYGERDDPYRVIVRLGQRLEATVAPETILPTIVETVAQALKLPYAAIALQQDGKLVVAASYGTCDAGEELHLPLAYQTEQVGELILAPRAPGEVFSATDRRLFEYLAHQVDIAAHAVRLTADLKHLTQDLQQARERLVSAREEERRRLRRDLHDGLGPQLSSQTLLLTSAQMLLRQDPDEAEAILRSAITQSQEAISDIRRLVYALRPPALDDLGLVAAIQEQLTQHRTSGIAFSLEAPVQLQPLPAAVEVACYRIVQEAITNVVRHAHARNCIVHLACEEQLTIEVIDDGQGLPPAYHQGVGLTSMRERAEELGGRWLIEPGPDGGTCIRVQIPYR